MVASFSTRTVANVCLPRYIVGVLATRNAPDRAFAAREGRRCSLSCTFPRAGDATVVARRTPRGIRSRGSGLRSSPRRARVERQVARPADARARAGDRPTEARKARGNRTLLIRIRHEHVRAQGGGEGASSALRFVQRPQEEWQWCHRVRCASRNPRSPDVRSRGPVITHPRLLPPSRKKDSGKNPRQHFPRVRRGFDPRRVARNPLAPSPEARRTRDLITARRYRVSDTPKAVSHPAVPS